MMMFMALLLVTLGSGISLLFIYTGGHLDQQSIERALPIMKHDVDAVFIQISNRVEFVWHETHRTLTPLWRKVEYGNILFTEILMRSLIGFS